LGINADTLEIWAIEVTDNSVGDVSMQLEMLFKIPEHERIASVSADSAYDTKACHGAIARHQADAIIPLRKNGNWQENCAGSPVKVPMS
jgi:hypothetical protein